MQLDVVEVDENREETGALLISAGGRWDRRHKKYVGDAEEVRELTGHPGQEKFLRWYNGWLVAHVAGIKAEDAERIYSALLAGGQRAGKTQVGTATVAVSYALAKPGSITWIVCPTDKDFEEIEDYLEDCMPRGWYKKLGSPWYRYTLANGSKIVLRSGHAAQALKKGRADLIIINEAQRISQGAFAICRGRIADKGGIVIGLANPPDSPIGQWVGDWAIEAEAGLRQSLFFYFDPFLNPYIDHAPLLALKAELDDHTFDVEVMGKFMTGKGMVIHNWDRFENEKAPPARAPNITREALRYFEGREYDRAVSVDVQKHPYMVSVEWNFFENPLALNGLERFQWSHMWAIGAVMLEGADEFDLATEWLAMGWDPERTLVICDASSQWQFSERDPKKVGELRKKLGGRGGYDAFRSMGFRHIVTPDREALRNPDIIERVRTTTVRIRTASPGPYGQHFIFSAPTNKKLNRCIRKWPTRHGRPSRSSEFAHAGDAFTYGPMRFFPRGRQVEEELPEVTILAPSNGSGRMKGW